MSLTGNLEDLPLLDIIQIVSFSQKTGYLTIRTGAGDAAIVFRDGSIVCAFTWDSLPVDARLARLPPDQRAAIVRSRIEMALEQLIRLRDGQFGFSLTVRPPRTIGSRTIEDETLAEGLNPQEVLLELARGMDEDRRNSAAALEASFAAPAGTAEPDEESELAALFAGEEEDEPAAAEPSLDEASLEQPELEELRSGSETRAFVAPLPAGSLEEALASLDDAPPLPAAAPPPEPPPLPPELPPLPPESLAEPPPLPGLGAAEPSRTLLLVDDEEDVRQVLAERFAAAGYAVLVAEGPEAAVQVGERLAGEGVDFLLLTDLGMPTTSGSSFQGGFEVVRRLARLRIRPATLLMADTLGRGVLRRAQERGIARCVFKPGLSKLDPRQFRADLEAFADKLAQEVLPGLAPAPGPGPRSRAGAGAKRKAPPPSRELRVLQQRLEELRRPSDVSEIAQLVMKVAREFFERALLMLVKDEELRGLGGFGPSGHEDPLHLEAREIVIPLNEPSLFLEVVLERRGHYGPLPEDRWCESFLERIGRFRSRAVALLPLLAHRETIAVLFGDNPRSGRDPSGTDALEVFIQQAGIALENAFLQRKLQALQQQARG